MGTRVGAGVATLGSLVDRCRALVLEGRVPRTSASDLSGAAAREPMWSGLPVAEPAALGRPVRHPAVAPRRVFAVVRQLSVERVALPAERAAAHEPVAGPAVKSP